MTKYHDSWHSIPNENSWYVTFYVTFRDIFSNSKKSNISNPTIFAGGPTLGGGVEPGRANGAWPSPRPARRVIFSKSRAQARPGLWDSNPTRRRPCPASEFPILVVCPAWPVRFSEYFRCFFVLLSPRGFEAATCLLARAPRLLWRVARSLQPAYEAESAMPLYRPSDTFGAAWVT